MASIKSHNLGFPRIGARRELKKATESYWAGNSSIDALISEGKKIRLLNWQLQQAAGIDLIPSNDFSFYDHMLDMSCLLGAIPPRFGWRGDMVDLDLYFRMARGMARSTGRESGVPPMEMTKWFDTNYHYLVPELFPEMEFRLSSEKIFNEYQESSEAGIETIPVLVGPVTYLMLGKFSDGKMSEAVLSDLLERLLPVYAAVLNKLETQGAQWIQLDEPVFVLDLSPHSQHMLERAYNFLADSVSSVHLIASAFFGELRENADLFMQLPVQALHIDAIRGIKEVQQISEQLPRDKRLSAGVVDGRNVWKNDFQKSLELLRPAAAELGDGRLWISPSCSLIHAPVTLKHERLDEKIRGWLSFAEEKLSELIILTRVLSGEDLTEALNNNRRAMESRANSPRIHRPDVKSRIAAITPADVHRTAPYSERRLKQRESNPLPDFPTTTIGSFPQTFDVRNARAKFRKKEWSLAEYETFLETEIEKTIRFQEQLDIDILVHGESERNDMVEYFGEQLDGFVFTRFGWVQSFGSRYVKPPLIFGDVVRQEPMTVRWSKYAQSLTRRPVKGMLTGPVTILEWSFVRDDQPRQDTCRQIALAIRDEVADLEKAGIQVIQIDEPALREGLPLRRSDRGHYLKWAVENFRLATSGVKDSTQIHTHMCYSEFNQIMDAIAALDTDVISIESSRSKMELLNAFVHFQYPSEIGPGVYDIHSPRIPSKDEIVDLLKRAAHVLPVENLWVNPDCGLKTRTWQEVHAALSNMVAAAKIMRKEER
jgi:5-methyltetrahydropteroyltriglutamate--homocysteine methyltransferase